MDYEQLVRVALAYLPRSCYNDYHEWVNGYGDPDVDFLVANKRLTHGEQMLPYFVCKHCSARLSKEDTTRLGLN